MTRSLTIIAAMVLIVQALIHLMGTAFVCMRCRSQGLKLQDHSAF